MQISKQKLVMLADINNELMEKNPKKQSNL